ncbi:phage protein Gp36 family protein [Flavobacterium suncheonense]|uniref:DUF1320 domain-containing protein n=1 Tax=Flavobacterium suncheonense GH29-5 = DSM 17707 TaxID=1121899 RepID=A0A0A2MDT0_9FLAO|nr:phage protein Gp36 family protein [Flavobacterium suncheonense]KGO89746.1 hypothetical protein Q764_06025 [Flavobacterium suncheonense GH29-5 = DSM 17707]
MFLEINDLGAVIYDYQIEQITEGNDDIVLQGLAAAEEEAKSYLTPNPNQRDYLDGRLLYDVETIFNATGLDRNALILQHCITIAKWHIVQLCNADIIYEQAKERYDRAIDWFTKIAKGSINLSSLPQLQLPDDDTTRQPFSFGSRAKFNHDY